MSGSLAAVAFLARSEHRVTILRALASEPRDRRGLESETGASRSTLSDAAQDVVQSLTPNSDTTIPQEAELP